MKPTKQIPRIESPGIENASFDLVSVPPRDFEVVPLGAQFQCVTTVNATLRNGFAFLYAVTPADAENATPRRIRCVPIELASARMRMSLPVGTRVLHLKIVDGMRGDCWVEVPEAVSAQIRADAA